MNKMPTKRPTVAVIMDEPTKRKIDAWAEKEGRSASNLCFMLLKEAIERKENELGESLDAKK